MLMAFVTFGLVAAIVSSSSVERPKKKARRLNADRRILLVVTFHLWFHICYDATLRSASARGDFMYQHVWLGDILVGEGHTIPCTPMVILVREKTRSEPSVRVIIAHDDPLQCCHVALGMHQFYLFSMLGLLASFDSILEVRVLPDKSGTDETRINLFGNMAEKEQEQLFNSAVTQISKEHPELGVKGIRKRLHVMRNMSNLHMEVIRYCG